MKQNIRLLLAAVLSGFLLAACGESHFLTDASYREQVRQDFERKQALMPQGDLFAVFQTDLTAYEREALEFLYAYMPLADITGYSGAFHLMNVRAARRAAAEMPWGKEIPEDVFRHFVLPVRVNNEPLDSARIVFYEVLKERVKSLSLADAILEVNHWCHEKAVYQPSDARTSSPLATVRTACGRCGEESTLLVAALRSVGIPARQVYTPRWAHTDDNHAWVEAWADGQWHFLGACEPEPVLDLGWFNVPASRGMLMHTKVFGRYEGPEEVMSVTPNYTEINVIDNYAPTAQAVVRVTDEAGQPLDGARVEFKLYNYAEFYTVATKFTHADGTCMLTAGRGDMLVWAGKDGRFGFAKLSFGKQDSLTVALDRKEGDLFEVDIDIVPPSEHASLPEVTPARRAENDRRLAQEDSIRQAYTSTFLTPSGVEAFADALPGLHPVEREWAADILVGARGNHAVLCRFLTTAAAEGRLDEAVLLLKILTEKDWRDVRLDVLMDHWRHTPSLPTQRYASSLLSPRVSTEELTPYKHFFQTVIGKERAETYRRQPQRWVEWCRDSITLQDTLNAQRIPMTPEGVWRSRVADRLSRDIFFVAVARSLGIPAWKDAVTGQVCYQDLVSHPNLKDGQVYEVNFEEGMAKEQVASGWLAATYQPVSVAEDAKYYTHFTLSKYDGGQLQLQNYDEGSVWSSLLRHARLVPAGYYLMTTGTRLADGSVLARVSSLVVEEGKKTQTLLTMREDKDVVQVIGNFNSESLFLPVLADGVAASRQSLLQACGRGYFVVGVLGVGQEPTNHALRDLAALQGELEQWGRKLVLLFPDEASYRKFRREDFPGLPATVLYGIDTDGIQEQIVSGMKLRSKDSLPIFIIADTFNRVVFCSQGYTIGLGDQLMRTVKGL